VLGKDRLLEFADTEWERGRHTDQAQETCPDSPSRTHLSADQLMAVRPGKDPLKSMR
jgi:hypothetical protein